MMAGLSELKYILQKAGVKVTDANGKESNGALDIARTYDAWTKQPQNRDAFFKARNALEDNMRWLGDVSIMAKTPYNVMSTYGFQALKPYLYGKINNIGRDYNKILKALLTKE